MSDYYFHQPLLESLNDWGLQNPQAWAQNELANEVLLAGIEACILHPFPASGRF